MPTSIHERIKTEQTPLIDRNVATFVWKGKKAPYLVGDFTGWDDGKPIQLIKREKNIWTYELTLPIDAYIEYGYVKDNETLEDPFNPRRTSNGIGGSNQYFLMPEYKPSKLSKNVSSIAHGKVTAYDLPTEHMISGNQRKIYLYDPPNKEKVPLVVVWDGREYLRRVRLNYIVDNLIAEKRIKPIALALVSNGGQKNRTSEYACNEATLTYLMTVVIPFAKKELNLLDTETFPGEFGIVGASMGGLMALYTGGRIPQVFGKVISQSGAFTWGGYDMVVFDLLKCLNNHPLKIWMDVGIYDLSGLLESNRRMQNLLLQKNYRLTYREFDGGHNFPSWRDDIWRGLEALYGNAK